MRHHTRTMAALLAVLLTSTSCESPVSPIELLNLVSAEGRWNARPFQSYSYEQRISCFCPPTLTQWARVEVVNGTVRRVVMVESGAEVGASELFLFGPLDKFFQSIRDAYHADWVTDIDVQFDPALGFPVYTSFVPKTGIMDAGSTSYLRNITPLP